MLFFLVFLSLYSFCSSSRLTEKSIYSLSGSCVPMRFLNCGCIAPIKCGCLCELVSPCYITTYIGIRGRSKGRTFRNDAQGNTGSSRKLSWKAFFPMRPPSCSATQAVPGCFYGRLFPMRPPTRSFLMVLLIFLYLRFRSSSVVSILFCKLDCWLPKQPPPSQSVAMLPEVMSYKGVFEHLAAIIAEKL